MIVFIFILSTDIVAQPLTKQLIQRAILQTRLFSRTGNLTFLGTQGDVLHWNSVQDFRVRFKDSQTRAGDSLLGVDLGRR